MFITFVINTEYMDYESRMKWYLKNLLFCKEHGGICVTHQNLIDNFWEYQKKVNERFLSEFEIEYFNEDDIKEIKQYAIEDFIFSNIEEEFGSRTKSLQYLLTVDHDVLHNSLENIYEAIKEDFPYEKILCAYHCLDAYKSIKDFCQRKDIPLISYTFSCMRKVHGYRQTLFISAINKSIYCTDDAKIRYEKFISENPNLPILSNKDIIALLGKERTLPLTLLMEKPTSHEIGICGEAYNFLPSVFTNKPYTDDDIHYKIQGVYGASQIKTRQHPYLLGKMQIARDEIMQDDPAAFILSCKRLTSVASQIMLKAMIWGRTPVMEHDTLPLSFACAKSFEQDTPVCLKFINFFIFCYMVPSSLMFNIEYWRWRLTKPSETEIYKTHIAEILKNINCSNKVIDNLSEKERFWGILSNRQADCLTVENMKYYKADDGIDWNAATSKLVLKYNDNTSKVIWGANNFKSNKIESNFYVEDIKNLDFIEFYAIDDRAAFIRIESFSFNGGKEHSVDNYNYICKHQPSFIAKCNMEKRNHLSLHVVWEYDNKHSGAIKFNAQ